MSRKRRGPGNGESIHPRPGASRAVRLFYVGVEGGVTEPDYLTHLNREFGDTHKFHIHPISQSRGFKPREVVNRVIKYQGGSDHLWALFDRDEHEGILTAMKTAQEAGVNVAFSHPSFDLWLLLHFRDFSGAQAGSDKIVHEKLRQQQGFERFSDTGDKSVTNARAIALTGNHHAAMKRARKLADDCPTRGCSAAHGHVAHCDPLKRDPSTDVWQLLVALGIVTVD